MPSNRPDSTSLADAALGLFWRAKVLRLFSSRRPIVLAYHAVAPGPADYFSPDAFERHVSLLKSRFHLVGPRECHRVRGRTEDIDVLLTFDDGFLNNALYVVPILKRHQVPAVFFISTRHCSGNRILWFVYTRALSRWFPEKQVTLDGATYDLSPTERVRSRRRLHEHLLSLKPHPQAMYDKIEHSLPFIESFVPQRTLEDHYAGMTWDHIREIAQDPLFEVGVHTVDHPLLTLCDDGELVRQIEANREDLEHVTGKRIRAIAYPGGDYDARVRAKCADLGFDERYAVEVRRGTGDGRRETADGCDIPRIGIYKPSLDVLGFKVQWGNLLRRTPLHFG